MEKKFPVQVFEDISAADFEKHNKKQVTEDFVAQNFIYYGWFVSRPFNDTGVDILAIKKVCPDNHTEWNEATQRKLTCEQCGKNLIQITRFIQVKTREIKGERGRSENEAGYFGYTLKSKDFRNDPRHVFLFYSDATNEFLIVPIYEYLKMFHGTNSGKSHFGTPSFRIGNNKMNNLRRDQNGNWEWKERGAQSLNFNRFLNEKGMKLISSPDIEKELSDYESKIQKMKFDLFYGYARGQETDEETETRIVEILRRAVEENLKNISARRMSVRRFLSKTLNDELKQSVNRNLIKYRDIDPL
ncbi:MAG: hypothetical protein RMM16_04720 [Chloroherpetonaceae bacterium]|nr:hypothetical protein [Chloroherpetonaceae bacterium]